MITFITPSPRIFQFQSSSLPVNKISADKRSPQYAPVNYRIYTTPKSCESSSPTEATSKDEIDRLFSRLQHVNKTLRKKASYEISEIATDEEIERLLKLLAEEDTSYRRSAVQTLGMIGMPTVSRLLQILSNSENSTVRASCAKALASVALYYPEARETFPVDAVHELQNSLSRDQDPVTRLSVVGCLGTLGSDFKEKGQTESIKGCEEAINVLETACKNSADLAVGTTIVSALAQIGQNGLMEKKQKIISVLESVIQLADSENEESALSYVKEIAVGHVDQLKDQMKTPAPTPPGSF